MSDFECQVVDSCSIQPVPHVIDQFNARFIYVRRDTYALYAEVDGTMSTYKIARRDDPRARKIRSRAGSQQSLHGPARLPSAALLRAVRRCLYSRARRASKTVLACRTAANL